MGPFTGEASRGKNMEWQPIETAPKRGLVLVGAYHALNGRWLIDAHEWDADTHDDGNPLGWRDWRYHMGNGTPLPTHWMPLPDPPFTGERG